MAFGDDRRFSLTNNFLFDFALRRQSLVSLNRVFGMGETDLSAHSAVNGETPKTPQNATKRKSIPHSASGSQDSVRSSHRSSNYSLSKMMAEKRARKVRFYRNGDRFFKGMVYAVSAERFRTFESLLTTLTMSPLCDKRVMPNGVRHIFTLDGARKIDTLDQLDEGESYVCASNDVFRMLDYASNENPSWNRELIKNSSNHRHHQHNTSPHSHLAEAESRLQQRVISSQSQHRPRTGADISQSFSAKASKSEMTSSEKRRHEEYQRSFVVPRLITVIRNGKKPRTAVRVLLNRKTAQTINQVMEDMAETVKLDNGSVKKIFTINGQQVACLMDFFGEDSVFLACGMEKLSPDDFNLDQREIRQVRAYRPLNGKVRERVTLRRSTALSQKSISSENQSSAATSVSAHSERISSKSDTKESNVTLEDDKANVSNIPMPMTLTNKYEVGGLIGTGNFAVVLDCKEKKSNRRYALKIINKNSCKEKEKMVDNEVRILRCLNHPNIIRLVEDYNFQHRIFFIMELVTGGDLFDAISSSTKYTEQDARGMVFNLASALDYLHSLHIVHRDVKPENIMIRQHEDGTKSLKLGDFGLATEVKAPLHVVCGTPTYVAPEVIAESGYGTKVDIWSLGVITYILLCGFPPFPGEDQDELFDLILTANYDFPSPHWDNITPSAKNLVMAMLELDPNRRFNASQVLKHKWIITDTPYKANLHDSVSTGLRTHFRRPKHSSRQAGIQIIAITAMDKASRYFQGRGPPADSIRGKVA